MTCKCGRYAHWGFSQCEKCRGEEEEGTLCVSCVRLLAWKTKRCATSIRSSGPKSSQSIFTISPHSYNASERIVDPCLRYIVC